MEAALHDIVLFSEFAGVGRDSRIPDERTILRFRHLLERNLLTDQILVLVSDLLRDKGLMLKAGMVVEATLISAPSSTKNESGERDPQMKQSRKGKQMGTSASRRTSASMRCRASCTPSSAPRATSMTSSR